ncbi:MAG: insulinase family protein, partial [Spirochaetaceae bacterium]
MKTSIRTFFTSMLIAILFVPFFSCNNHNQVLPLDKAIIRETLPNGMTLYLRQNSEPANRIFLRLVVNAGSTLETENQQGLAHFVEHAAFLGTEKFEQKDIVTYL